MTLDCRALARLGRPAPSAAPRAASPARTDRVPAALTRQLLEAAIAPLAVLRLAARSAPLASLRRVCRRSRGRAARGRSPERAARCSTASSRSYPRRAVAGEHPQARRSRAAVAVAAPLSIEPLRVVDVRLAPSGASRRTRSVRCSQRHALTHSADARLVPRAARLDARACAPASTPPPRERPPRRASTTPAAVACVRRAACRRASCGPLASRRRLARALAAASDARDCACAASGASRLAAGVHSPGASRMLRPARAGKSADLQRRRVAALSARCSATASSPIARLQRARPPCAEPSNVRRDEGRRRLAIGGPPERPDGA